MKCEHCSYETSKKSNLLRHVKNVHTQTEKAHICLNCDRKFKYQSNLTRHMVSKTCIQPAQQNNTLPQQNVNIPQQNVNISHVCQRCSKTLASKQSLDRHVAVCDGTLNAKMCPKCHKTFAFRQSKTVHMKTCEAVISQHHTNNIHTQNNYNNSSVNVNNINHQQNNNNNITIVTFNPEDIHTIVPLLTDHIDMNVLRRAIKTQQKPDVLLKYTEELLKKPENRCVKKTNLRSSHSSVHVGNNRWRLKPDALVYPKLVSDIATLVQALLEHRLNFPNIPKHIIDGLAAFNEYMCDNGYCNETPAEADNVKHGYKRVVSGTKSLVYEQTKGS